MPAPFTTWGTPGAFDAYIPGCPQGGSPLGIAVGALVSGADMGKFTPDSEDHDGTAFYYAISLGPDSDTTTSGTCLGYLMEGLTLTAGSGYPPGVYRVQSAGGGAPAGAAEIEFTIGTNGAMNGARVVRPGSGFTSVPTFNVATAKNFYSGQPIVGGSGATIVAGNFAGGSNGPGSGLRSLGTPGTNKFMAYMVATAPVAVDAPVVSGWINRSGRALVAGDGVWTVQA